MNKNITWKNEMRRIGDLIPADYNPRKISDKERADLTASIVEFGKVIPIVVNAGRRANNLIGGHQRVQIYADLGKEDDMIEVRVPDRELTLEEEKELNIRLNKNTASWDFEKMTSGFSMDELTAWGFHDDDLKAWYGMAETAEAEVTEERLRILAVFPPEAPNLKEKAAIRFADKDEYDAVKGYLEEYGSTAVTKALVELTKKKA